MGAVAATGSWITLDARKNFSPIAVRISTRSKGCDHKRIQTRCAECQKQTSTSNKALRSFKSHNVIGQIRGADPKLKDE